MFGRKKKMDEANEKPEAEKKDEAEVTQETPASESPAEEPALDAKPEVKEEVVHVEEPEAKIDWSFKFLVKLHDVPAKEIEAVDADDAWKAYKKHFGILSTDHKPSIVAVK